MEVQLTDIVRNLEEINKILKKIEGPKIEGIINRKFIVKIDVDSCFKLLSDKLTITNINSYNNRYLELESHRLFGGEKLSGRNVIEYNKKTSELENNIVHKVNHNVNLNHIYICFQKNRYLEIFIIPIEKDISEIHIINGNIQMDYFQNYLQLIDNILKSK